MIIIETNCTSQAVVHVSEAVIELEIVCLMFEFGEVFVGVNCETQGGIILEVCKSEKRQVETLGSELAIFASIESHDSANPMQKCETHLPDLEK
jgi:hypothetical protein